MSRTRSVPLREVIIVLIFLVLVVIGAGVFVIQGFQTAKTSTGGPTAPSTVKIQGTIDTVGWATTPVGVEFKDANSDTRMSGAVYFSPNVPGQRVYEIVVLNQRSYTVSISWVGIFGYRGSCNAGSVTVNAHTNSTFTDNIKC